MSDQSRYHRYLREDAIAEGRYPSGRRKRMAFEEALERQAADMAKTPAQMNDTDNNGVKIPYTVSNGGVFIPKL